MVTGAIRRLELAKQQTEQCRSFYFYLWTTHVFSWLKMTRPSPGVWSRLCLSSSAAVGCGLISRTQGVPWGVQAGAPVSFPAALTLLLCCTLDPWAQWFARRAPRTQHIAILMTRTYYMKRCRAESAQGKGIASEVLRMPAASFLGPLPMESPEHT